MKERLVLAIGGSLLYLVLVMAASWNDSATYDEPTHMMSGYLCLEEGRYEVDTLHPPLTKLLAGLALTVFNPSFDPRKFERMRPHTRTEELAGEWLWSNRADPQTMLRACRFSVQRFNTVLVASILWLLSGLVGTRRSLVFFLLAILNPPFLGLSAYVITDAANALLMVLGLLLFVTVWNRPDSAAGYSLLALTLFAGLATKHSFLLLPAVLCTGSLGLALFWRLQGKPLWVKAASAGLRVALCSALAFLFTVQLYGFCMRNTQTAHIEASIERSLVYQPYLQAASGRPALYPLAWYLTGLGRVVWMVETGGTVTTSFMSKPYKGGELAYFPILLLSKENSLILLTLLMVGIFSAVQYVSRESKALPPLFVCSAAVCFCYFVVAVGGSLNIGFRHVLPAFFLAMLAFCQLPLMKRPGVLALLAAARLVSLLVSFPHFLSYFNFPAGGLERGYQVSVISDADWSQDFLRLRHYMQDNGEAGVFVYPASHLDPGYYLGHYYLRPGSREFRSGDLIAISTTFLEIPSYLSGPWEEQVELAVTFPKVGQIGGSIVIFKVP